MDFWIQNKFLIFITLFCFFALFVLWQISNFWGAKSRGRRRAFQPSKRKSDSIVLSSMEKKLLKEAHSLLKLGKVTAAARLFEQIGLHREAIQTLEDHGLIHEAAKILMRMGRHNRAGVVYARHGLWDFAAQSFKMANMPLEVAKCAKESGDIKTAAEYFELAERFEEAADSLYQLGELKKSGNLYIRSGAKEKAFTIFNQIGLQKNLSLYEFSSDETKFVIDTITQREIYTTKNVDGLIEIVTHLNTSKQVVQNLVLQGGYQVAIILIKKCQFDIGIQLISEINYQSEQPVKFAQFFMEANLFQNAGIIYEKMSEFSRAGECFEKAQDFSRAIYCYERAGIHEKSQRLKSLLKTNPPQKQSHKSNSIEAKFALSDGPDSSILHTPALGKHEDSTEILNISATQPPKPTSVHPDYKTPNNSASRLADFNLTPVSPPSILDSPIEESQSRVRFPLPIPDESSAHNRGPLPPIPESPSELNSLPPSAAPDTIHLKKVFGSIKFFTDLDAEQIDALWNLSVSQEFTPNSKILTYQDEPLGIYVILKGNVDCFRMTHGQESFLDQMIPGESFGELWLLTDTPSTVSFVASNHVTVRIIYRVTFNGFLDSDGTVARKLYKRFTTRLLKRLLNNSNQKEKKAAS